jgi:hypothetical protein
MVVLMNGTGAPEPKTFRKLQGWALRRIFHPANSLQESLQWPRFEITSSVE